MKVGMLMVFPKLIWTKSLIQEAYQRDMHIADLAEPLGI